ncbi:MAG: siroheme synthase CysG [Alphaproteobacteria bacterium]
MDYFPIFTELKGKPVLVVGGGEIAYRKVKLLLAVEAQIELVAQKLNNKMQSLVNQQQIAYKAKEFHGDFINHVYLVIAATDNHELNQHISQEAKARFRFVNVVDKQDLCSFITPSIIDRSPIMVAVASSGKSPTLIRRIREKIEAILPQHIGIMAEIAGSFRKQVKAKFKNINERRYFWESLFDSDFEQWVAKGENIRAIEVLQQSLAEDKNYKGKVTLVGAGPGDAGLLTLKALQAIQSADIIYYDNLVSMEVLELARRDATLVFVGKQQGCHSMSQQEINQALVVSAQKGFHVVRLKGGDPYIFGRGAEEVAALKAAKLPYQVISGITAALGASSSAEIPLTARNKAQMLTFVTGHEQKNNQLVNWKNLADMNHTLVIYMGLYRSQFIKDELIKYGRCPQTPIAIIENATRANQKIFYGQLDELETLSQKAQSPSLIIIGDVVS